MISSLSIILFLLLCGLAAANPVANPVADPAPQAPTAEPTQGQPETPPKTPSVPGGVPPSSPTIDAQVQFLPFCWIGDSWASGVAWAWPYPLDIFNNAFEGNKDGCARVDHSAAIQIWNDGLNENPWYDKSKWLPIWKYPACSGSVYGSMGGQFDHCHIDFGLEPRFAVMSAGGNNAQFGGGVDACVFHSDVDSYKYVPSFENDQDLENCKGECCKQINATQTYIRDHMPRDFEDTIIDILGKDSAKKDPKFHLYVTGYAKFWNTDDSGDWCDKESFNADPTKGDSDPRKSFLTKPLRLKMNDLVEQINTLYINKITEYWPNKVSFIDISPAFEGHRFCEGKHKHYDQYNSNDVWLWNLQVPFSGGEGDPPPTEKLPSGFKAEAQFGASSSGPGNVNEGWIFRPFHPKRAGHKAIKDVVAAKLKADGIGQ